MSTASPHPALDPPPQGTAPTAASRAQTPTGRPAGRRGRRSGVRAAWVGGAVITACLAVTVALFGQVSGREFAPSHFAMRDFSFVEIPLLQLQITPIRRVAHDPPLAGYLRAAALIPPPAGAPAAWHLVELTRGVSPAVPADAKLLSDFLELPGKSRPPQPYWQQWSIDHPPLAAILWPEIHKLAQRELYLLIPELFRIAESASGAEALRRDIDDFLLSHYQQLIRDALAAGQSELAESLRQEAISDFPDDPRWQQR